MPGADKCHNGSLASDKAFLFTLSNSAGQDHHKMELIHYRRHRAMKCLEHNGSLVFGDGDISLEKNTTSNSWVVSSALPVSYTNPVSSDGAHFLFNKSWAVVSDMEVLYMGGMNYVNNNLFCTCDMTDNIE